MSEATPVTTSPMIGFNPPQKPTISYDDFAKLDLRIATITSAEFHPNADRLLKVQLDDGTPQGRQVCAGIRQWYDPATLVGKQVVIVANLAERTIRGEASQGMILAASDLHAPHAGDDPASRNVIVLTLDKLAKAGSVVT